MGGICIACKPFLEPELVHHSESSVTIRTPYATLACCYAPPETSPDEVAAVIESALQEAQNDQIIILMGYINTRVDSSRSKKLLALYESTSSAGLCLLNEPHRPTYICHNGKSVVDLVCTNIPSSRIRQFKYLTVTNSASIPLRKHIPIHVRWKIPHQETRHPPIDEMKPKIDINILAEDPQLATVEVLLKKKEN